ncbi:KTSC domain-containing protein [Archangium lansingense]|uniref:KTSC domain-containing protein n=1 Tax=Archangium lansingense TaxID=2995310 RepID=UPI00358DA8F1
MLRQPVQSSNVASIGYVPESQTLEVEFKDSAIYQYLGVPAALYDALMRAPSKGAFLHERIKDRFSYRRIR